MAYTIGKGKPPKHTRFKKGQSGNPEGARKHNQDIKRLKKILRGDMEEILNELLQSNLGEIATKLKNKDTDVLTLALGSVLMKCIKRGDAKTLMQLADVVTNSTSRKHKTPSQNPKPQRIIIKHLINPDDESKSIYKVTTL